MPQTHTLTEYCENCHAVRAVERRNGHWHCVVCGWRKPGWQERAWGRRVDREGKRVARGKRR